MRRSTQDAVYQRGALWLTEPLALPENTHVRVAIETDFEQPGAAAGALGALGRARTATQDAVGQLAVRQERLTAALPGWLVRVATLELILFAGALLIYLVTHLWALTDYPIYFFTDEAYPVNRAAELISQGFHNNRGEWFPIYFERAAYRWMPLGNIYTHVIPVLLFGKSVVAARATSALISLFGVIAVALILKLIFRVRYWWLGALVMGVAPAWFLHSRTAFEAVTMTSFFALFLLFYLLYRTRSWRYLIPALVCGAATFYSYSNGQMVMAAAGVLLLISDFRYHLSQGRRLIIPALLGVLLMMPALSFSVNHANTFSEHLRQLGSYWVLPIPLHEKVLQYIQTYLYGISPQHWFLLNPMELERHRMDGLAHLPTVLFPFLLVGLGLCIWRFRSSPYRAVLIAVAAAPAGAALAQIGITRVLAFVVPASLLIVLGIDFLLARVPARISYRVPSLALFAIFGIASLALLRIALVDGGTWSRNYGLYGMQYGAQQVFGEGIPRILASDPKVKVAVTPIWSNDPNEFVFFFTTPEQRARMRMEGADGYLQEKRELGPDLVAVMTGDEMARAQASHKFKDIKVESMIPYPDGTPGFYFARLTYVDDIDQVFEREREERARPVTEQVRIDGQMVQLTHSRFDGGRVEDMFDNDNFSLARVMEANPALFDFTFPEPRPVPKVFGSFGGHDLEWTIEAYAPGESEPVRYQASWRDNPPEPKLELALDRGPELVSRLRIQFRDLKSLGPSKIHVREIRFN